MFQVENYHTYHVGKWFLHIYNPSDDASELKIYPNPSDDFINIEFQNINKDNFYLTIENTLGQEILRDYFIYSKSSFFHKIDVSSFSNGIYYLNINTPNSIISNIITIHFIQKKYIF